MFILIMDTETKSTTIIDNDRQFWKEEEENILKEWSDKAQCFEWMHQKTHNIYKKKNGWFTIPVIIISTITGTANFAQERIPEKYINLYVMIIGSFNIIAGILTTVYQYLKISELNEANRVAYLSWGKFYRNIKTELSKHPLDRMRPKELLKIAKEEFDRLVEISPPIPQSIVDEFNKKIKNESSTDLKKPEICNVIIPTHAYELTQFEREEMRKKFIIDKETPIIIESTFKDQRLENFKKTFFELNNRYPTEEELNSTFYTMYQHLENNTSSDENTTNA